MITGSYATDKGLGLSGALKVGDENLRAMSPRRTTEETREDDQMPMPANGPSTATNETHKQLRRLHSSNT
jgi:hypothetical protein